ncbi:peptidase S8/S53 domain-containing protein [Cantharellus anzutake]|uniref:peptidase S8/S53 domain-containing protein n=1 Tax=Cantharellus anzutake TaxID=1750568 RepID=UPI001905DEB4|nr:peptidase S8/S53 domain-containing protein [Cantharellus anzutake]KAF8335044.1 peptidase S8/S53 domain-containing protein [Cantharellus anzutake]
MAVRMLSLDVCQLFYSEDELFKKRVILPLRINLMQPNEDLSTQLLYDISNPNSANYGQHLSAGDVMKLFEPTDETVKEVTEWLFKELGVSARERVQYYQSNGALLANVTITEAEFLLRTTYSLYHHPPTGKYHIACDSYSVPTSIAQHIDLITPTVHFDLLLGGVGTWNEEWDEVDSDDIDPSRRHEGGLTNCDQKIQPACLKALYSFEWYKPRAINRNSYGIVELTPQSYIPSDLDIFAKNFTPNAVKYRPKLASINGGTLGRSNSSDFDNNAESNLDLEYSIALTYPTPNVLYQVGDRIRGASFDNFLDGIDASYCTFEGGDDPLYDPIYPNPAPGGYKKQDCGKYKPTPVISISYGYNEANLTPRYARRQCTEYKKLGLMGVTVLYPSGDFGVAGNEDKCINPKTGEFTWDPAGTKFAPSFPGTCPWVTSVGATQMKPGSTVTEPEAACELGSSFLLGSFSRIYRLQVIYSGGGFSNIFPIPDYQRNAIKTYFKFHKPKYSSAQYNNSMKTRGYPDISANGANYVVAIGGSWYRTFGTSASNPVVGAIITLINDARLAVGKRPVGFINPVLYTSPGILNDITMGNNPGCGTSGFEAVKGWDPVTGYGTPNFSKMLATFMALP